MIVEEDCWIGTNVTLLPGAHIGRGAVVAACALVNKPVPPYAVVAGVPAKVIGCKFSKEQIMAHEEKLYAPEHRMSEEQLIQLFETTFQGKKVLGTEGVSEDKLKEYHDELKELGHEGDNFNF